ncbi:MAG: hypothetical protein K6G03_11130 [Lachnospiraceae bacterium]|nr:hypothetical protein [Lachnospiraceae bacterium]
MSAFVFGSKLDLLVLLYDTTTGALIEERNIVFKRDGLPVRPEFRAAGTYIFINTGREDFLMRIEIPGYEVYECRVCYEELDERIPECDVFLMPSENISRGNVLSFSGTLPFLKKVEAVRLSMPVCQFHEYNKKNSILLVFGNSSGTANLSNKYYGILREDKMSYEKIEVEKRISPLSVRLKEPLQEEFASNLPIMRVIFGYVAEDGRYLLRVRDDGGDSRYLVRYEVNEEVKFQVVDFLSQEGLN